ncbi:MAG: HAMP domain-containing histidine kinase [Firmicutes bacterium]|jgi:signal transduction histidine kinase|nr:HAMP domain-containing histidine kinase [Bacillota bacterium]
MKNWNARTAKIKIGYLFKRRSTPQLPSADIIIDIGKEKTGLAKLGDLLVSYLVLLFKTPGRPNPKQPPPPVTTESKTNGGSQVNLDTDANISGASIKHNNFKRSIIHIPLGLKNRVTLVFSAGALVLSASLATVTYITTSNSILNQETSSLLSIAYANAFTTKRELQGPHPFLNYQYTDRSRHLATVIPSLLDEITGDPLTGTYSLVYVSSNWYHYPTTFTQKNLPANLLAMIKNGTPAEQYFDYGGVPHLAIGIPIPSSGALYIGVFDLSNTANTLHILLITLFFAAIATTLAGAILGRWAAGRSLRPLTAVSRAAEDIASGKPETRLATTDVGDLSVMASSFNTMVDKLQERIERDARFTSDVSHELRSPLTTLTTSLSVLESRKDEMPERSRQALDLLASEVRRFQRMVSDLLEISKMDAGAAELIPDEVEIDELITKAVNQFSQNKVPVIIDEKASHLRITAEKRRIERIVANLLENANRYAGGATRVTVDLHGDFVRVSVEDHGPGIESKDRERIFERFSRGTEIAGKRGMTDGTGLGLALVQEHVKLHKGHIYITDNEGGGARFVFEIPTNIYITDNAKKTQKKKRQTRQSREKQQ